MGIKTYDVVVIAYTVWSLKNLPTTWGLRRVWWY